MAACIILSQCKEWGGSSPTFVGLLRYLQARFDEPEELVAELNEGLEYGTEVCDFSSLPVHVRQRLLEEVRRYRDLLPMLSREWRCPNAIEDVRHEVEDLITIWQSSLSDEEETL